MNKIYFLSTCDTCKRIIKELGLTEKKFIFQDIKTEKITPLQLKEMKEAAGGFEALFSRVALKYKALDPKPSAETEFRDLILSEYTFLKRPVILIGDKIFVGNSKGVLQEAKKELEKL
ncbi:MAG: arsenate reductase [Bacteroidota bacterium]|jgi:arsenate reductase|nr:arsenate reductase [Bacteroidota bacterium]